MYLILLGSLLQAVSNLDAFLVHHQALKDEDATEINSAWDYSGKDYDYEVVTISDESHPHYRFQAFGIDIKLHLKPNKRITSESFQTFLVKGENKREITENIKPCYFLHRDDKYSAAVNLCHDNKMKGQIFFDKYVIEIAPAHDKLAGINTTMNTHLVKRNFIENITRDFDPGFHRTFPNLYSPFNKRTINVEKYGGNRIPVIEAALFFDAAAYKIFAPYFKNDIVQIRDMLLAYMNGVQALYHHPSTGRTIDITLSRLEIFESQPEDLRDEDGDREPLLESFCRYNDKQNPTQDENPQHWDIGLYVSGLDFFAIEKGRKSGVTMGLAVVGGICQRKYSCVIAEFGVTNIFGKPYPSAGFTSVFVLAHEIGHSLGMHHDGYDNDCPKDGYIMSPSRGVVGETLWSTCSAQVLTSLHTWATCLYDKAEIQLELDHRIFEDAPGMVWNSKRQCEILLKDQDAEPVTNGPQEEICRNVQCKSPHRTGYYFAGPAMEGTLCASGKWCQGGECVVIPEKNPKEVIEGGWSAWATEPCRSGCILKSKGARSRQRTCNNPTPFNTNEGCEGSSYQVELCNDQKICHNKRTTVDDFASMKCQEFSKLIGDIDRTGLGLQAPHETERPWMGCAIFCRRSDGMSYYTPRLELNDAGIDPYFPDGTWCHREAGMNYYCIQHHCLPENFQFNKHLWEKDIPFLQNAPPHIVPLDENLKKYLSIDINGIPLLKALNPSMNQIPPEDAWEAKDYIEIPSAW